LSDFKQNSNVSTDFSKISDYKISWKSIQQFPSCCMWICWQTDRHDEAIDTF
jgi:hypothetical protein